MSTNYVLLVAFLRFSFFSGLPTPRPRAAAQAAAAAPGAPAGPGRLARGGAEMPHWVLCGPSIPVWPEKEERRLVPVGGL